MLTVLDNSTNAKTIEAAEHTVNVVSVVRESKLRKTTLALLYISISSAWREQALHC
jgi:hypothetical protein